MGVSKQKKKKKKKKKSALMMAISNRPKNGPRHPLQLRAD